MGFFLLKQIFLNADPLEFITITEISTGHQ